VILDFPITQMGLNMEEARSIKKRFNIFKN